MYFGGLIRAHGKMDSLTSDTNALTSVKVLRHYC